MTTQCIYNGDRMNDYIVHDWEFLSDYKGKWDPKRLMEKLIERGFDHGGITAEVAYVGIGYCIVTVHFD